MGKKISIKHLLAAVLLTASVSPFSAAGYAATNTAISDLAKVSAERQNEIKKAIQQGLLLGDPDGDFRPFDSITRQDMAVILTRALQLTSGTGLIPGLLDVKADSWSAASIEAVLQAGLMTADSQGQFRPKAAMTYQELAVVLSRAVQWQASGAEDESSKGLKTAAPWAIAALNQSLAEGVFSQSEVTKAVQPVQRQALAGILLNAFFPEKRSSTLQRINEGSVKINGITYTLSDRMKPLLRTANAKVLEGAKIKFTSEARKISGITSLEITTSGVEPQEGRPEFSGNLELNGGGSTLDGQLKISGDYISVSNLTVSGDLEISPKLSHDFSSKDLTVSGQTRIYGGDSNTVVFEDASLGQVDINKQDVHVDATGSTAIDKMTVASNASLTFGDSSSIKQVTLQDGAANVSLSGNLGSLELAGSQQVTVSGRANIGEVVVTGSGAASLNLTGSIQKLTVNNPEASVTVGNNTKVETVSLGTNVSPSALSGVNASPQVSATPAPASPTTAPAVNQAPIVTRVLEDRTISILDGDTLVDVTGLFNDPDNDKLTIGALTSNKNVVAVKLTGNNLTLTPASAGSAVITLRASDGKGHLASTTFNVTVVETPASPEPSPTPTPSEEPTPTPSEEPTPTPSEEPAPTPSEEPTPTPSEEPTPTPSEEPTPTPSEEPIPTPSEEPTPTPSEEPTPTPSEEPTPTPSEEPTPTPSEEPTPTPAPNQDPVGINIPNQTLEEGDAAKDIDLSLYFSDPDQDVLAYSATVDDPSIASSAVNGNTLTLTPLKGGSAVITVKANDSRGGSAEATISLTVTPKAQNPNAAPEVVAAIQTQLLSPGYTNERSYDLSQLFNDPEGDDMTYSAVSSDPAAAKVSVDGNLFTLSPGTAGHAGAAVVTITATDSHSNKTDYQLNVIAVSLVNNGYIPVNTKIGVPSITVDLSSYFPADPSLQQYWATPDQTLVGPTSMNGKVWTEAPMNMDYWVVGANYKAVLIRVSVAAQTNTNAYFSQYIDGGNYNKTFQIRNPYFGTNQKFIGYSLEIKHYNPATNQTTSETVKIFDISTDQIVDLNYVNVIDRAFYEFFDLINAYYYNLEAILNVPNTRLTAIILKKDGQTIDVLGDPNGQTEILPSGGTIIRKSAIHSSSLTYNLPGEWNLYPKGTYQYYNQQTP